MDEKKVQGNRKAKGSLLRDVVESHNIFIRKVAENRGMEIEEVEKIADGSSMLGKIAKDNGLIDEIGDLYNAKRWISKKLNIYSEVCVY